MSLSPIGSATPTLVEAPGTITTIAGDAPPPAKPVSAPESETAGATRGADEEKGSGEEYEGNGTEASPFVVRFQVGDMANPLNWSQVRKWTIVPTIAVATLCVAFGSSVYAGGIKQMEEYFEVSTEVVTVGLSVYVLGFALGPLLWAPFSEMFGRRLVHLVTYLPFAVFHLGCGAARNIETLIICRFFAGLFGSAPLTNSGGVISDMFSASERALAISFFALAPFAGPVLGPIIGGFVGENTTWRWLFWIEAIFSGVMYVLYALVPESYAPVLLRWRAEKLSKDTGLIYRSEYEIKTSGQSLGHKLSVNIMRPFVLLFKEWIVALFALYAAVIYGTLYLMFGAFPIVFQIGRGWSEGIAGLPFLGVGIGMLSGIVLNFFFNAKYVRDLNANGGSLPPEARLPLCCIGGCSLPIGLFWFAWTVQRDVHWIVPILAAVPFGLGMVLCFLSMTNYMVDAYLMYAASALAANSVLRSIFGAVFPLFTDQMFARLGNNWALTLLAFLTLALAPIPFLFMKYGARIRQSSKFAPGHKPATLSRVPTRKEEDLQEEQREADLRLAEESAA